VYNSLDWKVVARNRSQKTGPERHLCISYTLGSRQARELSGENCSHRRDPGASPPSVSTPNPTHRNQWVPRLMLMYYWLDHSYLEQGVKNKRKSRTMRPLFTLNSLRGQLLFHEGRCTEWNDFLQLSLSQQYYSDLRLSQWMDAFWWVKKIKKGEDKTLSPILLLTHSYFKPKN